MEKTVLTGFIATSDVIPFYGKAVLSEENVRSIYKTYQDQGIPMIGNHDERNVVEARVLSVDLRRTPTGALGVWVEVEFDDEADVAGYGGWSIGWFENNYQPADGDPRPVIRFGADAAHFTDEERDRAAAELGKVFAVSGGRYYQLGLDGPAAVVLMVAAETIRSIPANVLGNLVYDALRHLIPSGLRTKPTLFKFSVRNGSSETRGVLETSDPELIREAIHTFGALVDSPSGMYVFDADDRTWTVIRKDPKTAAQGRRDRSGKGPKRRGRAPKSKSK